MGLASRLSLVTVRGQGFDLVEQHDRGAGGRGLADGLREEVGYGALRLSVRRAGQSMRLHLEQTESTARERQRDAVGKTSRERGLAGPGRTHQEDDAVQRQHRAVDLAANGEV